MWWKRKKIIHPIFLNRSPTQFIHHFQRFNYLPLLFQLWNPISPYLQIPSQPIFHHYFHQIWFHIYFQQRDPIQRKVFCCWASFKVEGREDRCRFCMYFLLHSGLFYGVRGSTSQDRGLCWLISAKVWTINRAWNPDLEVKNYFFFGCCPAENMSIWQLQLHTVS